ncbi:MAG: hypothetical protein JOS17DRAFT_693243 [Linnemannia elongata]|nr:MAG: hypothetical protein JOS17DRAFT_693243 [Linnemannia elongata]
MPYKSGRQQLLSELETLIILLDNDGEEDEAEELYLLYLHVLHSQYSAECAITRRPPHYLTERFPSLTAEEFRSMFRTTREGFSALLDKIQDHPIFSNNSTCPQAHPSLQLAVALTRLGVNGTGASVSKIQAIFGIGTGTATVYTNRVVQALWDMRKDWVVWPNFERRREIGRVMRMEGFPNCVGFIDGTTLPLSQKPALDGEVYFDRKKR